MENILLRYMSGRANQNNPNKVIGPVVTLSREFGCYATEIASMLATKLNVGRSDKMHDWHVVTKEVIEDAAQKLETTPKDIEHIFGADEKGFFGDLVTSFSSKKYSSDSLIKATITKVVQGYSDSGNVIIVGRAGCVITAKKANALHFRLVAPFDYRVKQVANFRHLSQADALELVKEMDEKRNKFMAFFHGDKPDSELYHSIFNRSKMESTEIVDAIYAILISRGFNK